VTMFWVAYMISPRFCHRFVGYLEEEAVKTYTLCLEVRWGLSIAVAIVSIQTSHSPNVIV